MTERLSDADLDAAARLAAGEAIGAGQYGRVTSLAFLGEVVAALRAQQAPTRDEPAAWGVEWPGGGLVWASTERPEVGGYPAPSNVVVPLYRHPAPATDEALDKGGALPAGATRTNDTGVPINVAQGRRDGGDQ